MLNHPIIQENIFLMITYLDLAQNNRMAYKFLQHHEIKILLLAFYNLFPRNQYINRRNRKLHILDRFNVLTTQLL